MFDDDDAVRSSRGDVRRRAILKAATEVFLEEGYSGASVDMVIARSGGSRKTLYDYFGNKEGLFLATVEYQTARSTSRFAKMDMKSDEPEKELFKVGISFLDSILAPEMLAMYRTIVAEAYRFPNIGNKFLQIGADQAFGQLANYLKSQSDAGRINIENPRFAARLFVSMVMGEMHRLALLLPDYSPTQTEIKRHVRAVVKIFLYGVCQATTAEHRHS